MKIPKTELAMTLVALVVVVTALIFAYMAADKALGGGAPRQGQTAVTPQEAH